MDQWHVGDVVVYVDYYITNMPLVHSANISVALDLSLGSDHKLMSLSFEYSVPVVPSTHISLWSDPKERSKATEIFAEWTSGMLVM